MNIKQLIGFKEGVLIGSRALNIAKHDSDFDIVVRENDMPDKIELEKKFEIHTISSYHDRVIPLGNTSLLRMKIKLENNSFVKVDLIVIDNDKDYEIYKSAIKTLKSLPKFLITDKLLRIRLFEESLIHFGFVLIEDKDDIPF